MGMFDYMTIDNKWIPEKKQVRYDLQGYQTKNLECLLNLYEIRENGELILVQNFDELDEVNTPVMYTGKIRFYDDLAEFTAWCVDGIVKEVIMTEEYS